MSKFQDLHAPVSIFAEQDPRSTGSNKNVVVENQDTLVPSTRCQPGSRIHQDPGSWILLVMDLRYFLDLGTCLVSTVKGGKFQDTIMTSVKKTSLNAPMKKKSVTSPLAFSDSASVPVPYTHRTNYITAILSIQRKKLY